MKIDLKLIPTFGVAGNFTGHLEQAGEASSFTHIKTAEAKAPKAIFPTYLPVAAGTVPEFLSVFPFDESRIIFPKGEEKLQIEPECAVICNVAWNGDQVASVTPVAFGASNDCSIRKDGAKKISQKKNWGACSKGLSSNLIDIDSFSEGGILDSYRIASFLVRDGKVHAYGEDSPVRDYSYIYGKLIEWMTDKFNNQQDIDPAENIHSYLLENGKPSQIMVSIGATRYTDFGEHNFLQDGDDAVVVVYPEKKYTHNEIAEKVEKGIMAENDISCLRQKVIM